jgi:hypothetical protein
MAELFVGGTYLYLLAGFLFALWFVTSGVNTLDPQARGSGIAFRLLIAPATMALWPLLLYRFQEVRRR